jgi:hypothetical protein
MPHTVKSVRAFAESQRESDEPDAILEILKAHDGKPLTKRLLAKLPGGEERWFLHHTAGMMTHLEEREYLRSEGSRGMHLLLARETKNVTVSATWIEEQNPAYFAGRRERNASRDKISNIHVSAIAQLMADRLNEYEEAKAKLDEAKANLDKLTDGPFAADRYDWEKLCGARKGKS